MSASEADGGFQGDLRTVTARLGTKNWAERKAIIIRQPVGMLARVMDELRGSHKSGRES
jgi:hypothetical protein